MHQDILIEDDSPSNILALRFLTEDHCRKNNEEHVSKNLSGVINPAANFIITDVNMPEETFIDADCLAYSHNINFDKTVIRADYNHFNKFKRQGD